MNTYFSIHYARRSRVLFSAALLSVLGLLTLPSEVVANNALAVKTLVEQARFWEGKGRSDLAVAAWKRLLQVDPGNTDALAAMAQFEADNNRPEAAKAYIDQLKAKPAVTQEAVRRIEGAIAMKSVNTDVLEQARAAAKAGRNDDAVGLYRQALEGRTLSGPLALEYYQTLGGSTNGWEDARRGLEKLRTDEPSNTAVGLAYAQHLTYRASTRREGIRSLADLSRQTQVARPATEAWRRALMWLEAGKGDLPLFQAYLQAQPNDVAVRSRATELSQSLKPKPRDPRGIALDDGFNALNGGDLGVAEKRFESLLETAPKNPDALGGLGIVRLKQERFADSEKLLSSALRISGNRKWLEALNTSRFWMAMQEGQASLDLDRFDSAAEAYQRAQKLDPDALLPKVALVRTLARADRLDEAQGMLDTMKDGPERREISQQLVKSKAAKALEAKQFAEAERLLLGQSGAIDSEGQELLAWSQYHQGKMVEAKKGFVDVYRVAPSKGAASGLVLSNHALKSYQDLLTIVKKDTGLLRDLVPVAVQQKISQGETRFTLGSDGRLSEVDPIIIFNSDIVQPATAALLNEKNPKKAYDLLAPVEGNLLENSDYGNLALLGMAATEVGDQTTAIRVLKKAAEETEDEAFYRVWAESLVRFGRDEEAEGILLKQLENLDAAGLALLGWTQSRLGKSDQAVERFASAYDKDPSEDAAEALIYSAVQSKKFPLILAALNKHPNGPLGSLVAPEIRTQIAAGERRFGVDKDARLVAQSGNAEQEGLSLKLEPRIRGKSGVAGEGKLRQGSVVATLNWQGETHHASLELERQHASDSIDRAAGQRWYAKWGMKVTPNIGIQLGIGRTLSGGDVNPATVGEAGVGYYVPEGGVGVRLFRRGNEESLLALAGTPDPLTGIRWGRLLERGIALNAHHKNSNWDTLGSLVVSGLEGQTVANNRKVELYGRSLRSLDAVPGFSVGPELYISRFTRNLSAFEPGHGGYFSPSRSITLGAFGRYETKVGTLALTVTGGLGWGYNREDPAPGDPISGNRPGQYPAVTGRGLAYHGRIEGLQLLGPHWNLGFGVGMQRSSYFSDWRANVFVQRRWLD
ncbi:MAG: cellulose synthase subunit BcsC-related outer membrane protein [Burkholderiaceae bacterium]|nr:cellulose synthase subunit BcsC-related outer membrane protein [Burkholderiaceae bacterium]